VILDSAELTDPARRLWINRREHADNYTKVLERRPEDIKVELQFADV